MKVSAILSVLLAAAALPGQTVTVQIPQVNVTPTQAVIRVTATNSNGTGFSGPCIYRISEGQSFTALVHDVDPVLFPGSNSDARPGSSVNGSERTFVAGTRLAAPARDGKFYSRALQANMPHWVGVTCGASAEVSASFKTQNPPLGNSYPELPPFHPAAFGNRAYPTIDFTDQSKTYIDPLTGILIKRLSGPLDALGGNYRREPFSYVWDVNGRWSNINNAISSPNRAKLATTSTPDAPLFLAWTGLQGDGYMLDGGDYEENNFNLKQTPNDLRLRVYGSGTNGGTLQACITLDSGVSCASDTLAVRLPNSPAEQLLPAKYPVPMFAGWGAQKQALSKNALSNQPSPTVHLAGKTITWTSGQKFIVERAPGSRVMVAGKGYTVATLDSPTQITLREQAAVPVDGTLQDYGAGVRVWMKATGAGASVSASFSFDHVTSYQFFGASNAEFDTCSTKSIDDIATDRHGKPISPPLAGFLCSIGQTALYLWIPSTGEARLMSAYYQRGVGQMMVPTNPFSTTDPKTLFASNSGTGHLYKAVLKNPPGNYTEYEIGPGEVAAQDNLVWTDVTASTASIEKQLASFSAPVQKAYATGLFPAIHFVGVVGGYAIYDSSSTGDGPCIKVRTLADTNQIVQAFDSWEQFPLRWGGCHSSPQGIGSLLSLTLNGLTRADRTAPLGGPFTLNITQMKRGGGWKTYTQPITAASNTNPVTFTAAANGIDPTIGAYAGLGPQITISGGTGAWAAVNGTWTATVKAGAPNTFAIPVDTSGFGAVAGALQLSTAPPLIHNNITGWSASTPLVITVKNSWGIADTYTDPANDRLQDGDPVAFTMDPKTEPYFVKTSGYPNNSFAVYRDSQLTQPVNGAEISWPHGGFVHFAERCPAGLPPSLTSEMQFDSGATGARCMTVRVSGEPCSNYATPLEHKKFPCKSDPSNVSKSSLSDIEVGDAVRDLSKSVYDETFVVVNKVKHSETDIELTLMRFHGNKVGGDTRLKNAYGNTHRAGWMPFMVPSNSHAAATGWMDATDKTNTFLSADPNFALAHGDFGYGAGAGLFTYAGGQSDSIPNKTIKDLLATQLTYTKKEDPAWAGSPSTQLTYADIQSYPGHRQYGAPPQEHKWKGDWSALNPSYGSGQSDGVSLPGANGLTNIRGGAYDPGSTTSRVYKILNLAGAFDRKRTPTYAWAGKYIFQDKSGPGSLITDADLWQYCVADNAGECRPSSAKNDVFLAASNVLETGGQCWTNTLNYNVPCFTGANPLGGWAVQMEIDPTDTRARRIRRLTYGFSAPGMHWTFSTWLQTQGGQWGLFSAPFVNGLRNEYFAMKLPPWPANQPVAGEDRSDFVSVSRRLLPDPAPFARIRFGYAENGPATSYFCTSRQEACSTDLPVVSVNAPYSFLGEAVHHAACSLGCNLKIPAVPGRVVYSVIDRLDASGAVLSTSPLEATAVP